MEAKIENKTVGLIIAAALIMILGVVFINVVSQEVANRTQYTTTTETVNIAGARLAGGQVNSSYWFHLKYGCPAKTQWRTDTGCSLVPLSVKNSTGATLTDPTDYVFLTNGGWCTGVDAGDIRFVGSELMNATIQNTTTVTYKYCADGYLSGWSSTIANLVPGFLALAILVAIAFLIFFVLKANGIELKV
jgi:hypothetical protein